MRLPSRASNSVEQYPFISFGFQHLIDVVLIEAYRYSNVHTPNDK